MLTSDPFRETPTLHRVTNGRGRPRRRVLSVLVVLAVAAGIAGWMLTRPDPPEDRLLVVDEEGVVSLLDPATGESAFEVPGATPTPDRSALLTAESTGGKTLLQSRDPVTGAVTVSYLDDRPARTYDLPGNIEPEMFSYDEDGLFVLQFEPPLHPTSYKVRRLDLATGSIIDTESPQVELNPRMRGRARAQVLHPEGTFLYTLYTVPDDGQPVYDPEAGDDSPRYAFIHAINLQEEWSYCVFLPTPIGTVDEAAVGLGLSPDGEELIVADAGSATIARVDTAELEVTGTSGVAALAEDQSKAAIALTDDGTLYLSAGTTLLEMDLATLQVTTVWDVQGSITGLALSASGAQLRVANGGAITLIDRASRRETGVLQPPGRGNVTLLGRPRGTVTEFPLECAC